MVDTDIEWDDGQSMIAEEIFVAQRYLNNITLRIATHQSGYPTEDVSNIKPIADAAVVSWYSPLQSRGDLR